MVLGAVVVVAELAVLEEDLMLGGVGFEKDVLFEGKLVAKLVVLEDGLVRGSVGVEEHVLAKGVAVAVVRPRHVGALGVLQAISAQVDEGHRLPSCGSRTRLSFASVGRYGHVHSAFQRPTSPKFAHLVLSLSSAMEMRGRC